MPRKVKFSLQHQDLAQIALHHNDLTEAIKRYFKTADGSYLERFGGYTPRELAEELQNRAAEIDRASVFSLLSAVEAAFRIDYLQRGQAKKKSEKTFRKSSAVSTKKREQGPPSRTTSCGLEGSPNY